MDSKRKQIGVITVRGPDYHPTRRLAEAARERGCDLEPINPYRVWPAYREGSAVLLGDRRAVCLDAVLPRQGAEIKDAALPLIAHMAQMGVAVINRLPAIERAKHKFFTLQALAGAALPVARTVFVSAAEGIEAALDEFGAPGAVLKPVSGRQGSGICRIYPGEVLPRHIRIELDNGRGVLVQQYIEPEGRQDLRALVIGGQVAGAMVLAPAQGDFRANVHLGGQGRALELSASLAETAIRAAAAVGLEIAGVDLMVAADGRVLVNEVNYAPGFKGLEAATGKDIAGAMIDYVLRVLGSNI